MTDRQAPHIAVVEDDSEMRTVIREILEEEGFRVTAVGDGEALLSMLTRRHPDLVILDLGLPGISGLDVLARLRIHDRVPTIIVSGKSGEADRVVGLELGADDYLVKPFSHRELLARVRAVLRRATQPVVSERLEFDGFSIDLQTRDVVVAGRPVDLTALEFDLLVFLASSPRQVFSRELLIDRVWGSSADWQTTATVSEHIHRLRRKIESDPSRPHLIQTVRGAGYRFVPQ